MVEDGKKTDGGDWDEVEPSDGDEDLSEVEPSDEDLEAIEAASLQGTELPDARPVVSRQEERRIIRRYAAGDITDAAALGRGDGGDITNLQARVKDLEAALKAVNKNLVSTESWWLTAVYLTPRERVCMERVMYANHPLGEVAVDLGLTQIQVLVEIRSAFAKRILSEPQKGTRF